MAGLPTLKALREERGLSQAQLYAELYAIHGDDAPSRGSIGNYEGGKTTPRISEAEIFADFFGVTLDRLAGREDPAVSVASRGPTR